MSRTEEIVNALADALEARLALRAVEARYARTPLEAYGEAPLAAAVKPLRDRYERRLDALRAQLTASGVTV